MDIKSFQDLIEWSKDMHHHLGQCMREGMPEQTDDRARELLAYLALHEDRLEKIIEEYEHQASRNTLRTHVYDYKANGPITVNPECTVQYGELDYEDICREIFKNHQQIIDLYVRLIGKAETADAYQLMESLLDVEQHESMLLAQQVDQGRAL